MLGVSNDKIDNMYLAVKKEHLNKYDVIHLDIQWCMEPAGGPEQVVSYISEKTIAELKDGMMAISSENIMYIIQMRLLI